MPGKRKRLGPLAESAADLAETGRVRPLETVNRLLLVTDGEERAQLVAPAGACEELRRQVFDNGPLRGIGVLRLVDQDMVDAAVDLVEHPGSGIGAGQEVLGLDDQVVIVERDIHELPPLVLRPHGVGDGDHGGACLRRPDMRELVVEAGQCGLRGRQSRHNRRLPTGEILAANLCARRSALGEEERSQRRCAAFAPARSCLPKAGFGLLVNLGRRSERREGGDRGVHLGIAERPAKFRQQRLFLLLAHAEQALERQGFSRGPVLAAVVIGGHPGKLCALSDHHIDHLADILAGGERHGLGESLAKQAFAVLGRA